MEATKELVLMRYLCENAIYTKQHIADTIGISYQILNLYLKGERQPRKVNLNKIKQFLDLDKLHLYEQAPNLTSDEWVEITNYISDKLKTTKLK